MKKIKSILFSNLCLLFVTVSVFSQNKIITKEEYSSALGNSATKADKIPNRITRTTSFYKNKVLNSTTKYISENIPPDKFRWVNIDEKNGVIVRNERIKIADIEYSKKGDGDWEKRDLKSDKSVFGGMMTGEIIETKDCWEYLLINTTLDNQLVNLYFSYHVSEIQKILYFTESRDWINSDGLILKAMYKVSNTIPENVTNVTNTTYEYNPKDLKIEAPIK